MKTVSLLRGINVGGKNRLPKADLIAVFEACGAEAVESWIQSGNVVSRAPFPTAELDRRVQAAIAERFGYTVPCVSRTAAEFAAAVQRCPYATAAATTPKRVQIGFLSEAPSPAAIAALDPDRSPGDRFMVRGAEIHMICPNGIGRSKLTNAWFERHLGGAATFRNWRTVKTLQEMAQS